MNKYQRDILTEERSFLISEIDEENFTRILSYLYSKNIILISHKEIIENEKGKIAQCHKLLNILPKRGKKAFGVFIDGLNEVGLRFVAERLVERNEENENDLPAPIGESGPTIIGDELDSLLITEVGEEINTYKGFVVIDEGVNTDNESLRELRDLFTRANYYIYTVSSPPPISDEIVKIPILLILRDIDDDYRDTIRHTYDDKHAIIFTQDDSLNVKGAYIFHGPSTRIIDKLVEFLSIQRSNFSIRELIERVGISGTNNLTSYFKLEWHR